jgi:serine/threonine protein kinase
VIGEGELLAGRYRLVSQVGAGAMGVVWKAHDERLHRAVAVKLLLPRAGLSEVEAEEAKGRVMREARLAARFHHPHAIAVYNVDEDAGTPYLIMEYLSSESLATVVAQRGPLPPAEVARIGSQVAAALAVAHEAGIVHRDIKPDNVLVAQDGTAKITDFGISHAIGDGTMTATGFLAGTPAYLAPEVARGQEATFSADVFSLGSTLYAAVEGTPPFGLDDNALALVFRVANSEITPPSRSGPLTSVLAWLLESDPARRPGMREASEALAGVTGPATLTTPTIPDATLTPHGWPVAAALPDRGPSPVAAHPGTGAALTTNLALPGDQGQWSPTERSQRRPQWAVVAAAISLLAVGGLLAATLIAHGGSTAGHGTGPARATTSSVPSENPPHLPVVAETTAGPTRVLSSRSAARPVPVLAPHPEPTPTATATPSAEPSPSTSATPSTEPSTSPAPSTTTSTSAQPGPQVGSTGGGQPQPPAQAP